MPKPASAEQHLINWWVGLAEQEAKKVIPKAIEYGAYDLELIGDVLAEMLGHSEWGSEQKAELGCFFYLLGKVARMASAYREGRVPSDDTLHDSGVYVRMMQRIRDAGGWPG